MSERPPTAVLLVEGMALGDDGPVGVRGGRETAGAEAVLRAHKRLHAAHGAVDLEPHLVAEHQRLQTHQTAQSAKGAPCLRTSIPAVSISFVIILVMLCLMYGSTL